MLWLRILSLVATASALNILLSNDDSWVSANIRETYKALRADGHDVLLVGSAVQQSGKGGSFVLPTVNITAPGGEFGSVPIGAPPFGSDPMDQNLWYFNGTPAATVAFGLDIVAPMHFGNKTLDLVVTGPNEGSNLGPFLYTLSGTLGAAYAAVYRGFPAVAFSGSNGTHRSFTEVTEHNDAATIQGKLVANFVAALSAGINTTTTRLLDLGVGVSVGFPVVGGDNPCVDPPFTATRITGGALMDKIRINATTGMPQFDDVAFDGLNVNFTGDPRLPGETNVTENCQTSVSVFAVDYDAPLNLAAPIQNRLIPIFGRTSLPEAA
ncbi:hypothetical protein PC9H_001263 [Pleurotus ostreatus]|uniref:Survival protein SurE-like phosphatase/nucleotidase domain-containing protein n=1 Tax=Pleurotus ostreatus TaxID=5322 RepID=A0A8H7DW16_PLEOS|nr:uncharacterized protein PC9H_001263 [Pleurotus ostreatus]KAF7440914.1 hypothetical protein PC9H_001263 [Pleurotus ostreatus]KAJ8699644.1 hypothetical protein PTI98_002738 [Pleurotus ostreatus]